MKAENLGAMDALRILWRLKLTWYTEKLYEQLLKYKQLIIIIVVLLFPTFALIEYTFISPIQNLLTSPQVSHIFFDLCCIHTVGLILVQVQKEGFSSEKFDLFLKAYPLSLKLKIIIDLRLLLIMNSFTFILFAIAFFTSDYQSYFINYASWIDFLIKLFFLIWTLFFIQLIGQRFGLLKAILVMLVVDYLASLLIPIPVTLLILVMGTGFLFYYVYENGGKLFAFTLLPKRFLQLRDQKLRSNSLYPYYLNYRIVGAKLKPYLATYSLVILFATCLFFFLSKQNNTISFDTLLTVYSMLVAILITFFFLKLKETREEFHKFLFSFSSKLSWFCYDQIGSFLSALFLISVMSVATHHYNLGLILLTVIPIQLGTSILNLYIKRSFVPLVTVIAIFWSMVLIKNFS